MIEAPGVREGEHAAFELGALLPAHIEAARALLSAACQHDAADRVAPEKLFGPAAGHPESRALGAWAGQALVGVAAVSGAWIRLLAVHPAHRGRGVGSALLAAAEDATAAIESPAARVVRVLDQPGNYLAPGVDLRNHETIAWLGRRGYVQHGERINLLVDLRANPRVSAARAQALAAACAGYELRRAQPGDAGALTAMITSGFSATWAFEASQAMRAQPPAVHVAVERQRGELVAFAAHDGNNRGLGWFGPTGTLPEHRGRGLGAALLCACLVDLATAGHATCEVAWIGPRAFYDRIAGTAGERRFAAMRKELS